jgi:alpha-D-ribose 1-methylphosphonate 5-triphosphate synthase subunit PhnH
MAALEHPKAIADQVLSAQATFRAVMDAMARPGLTRRVETDIEAPEPLMRGTAAIALTLFDNDTAIWLDETMARRGDARAWIRFNAGAPVTEDPASCAFALFADPRDLPPLERFALGSDTYPDRSTTLIVQMETLDDAPGGACFELSGPGIAASAPRRLAIEPPDLVHRLAINETLFPRGIDVILVCNETIVALPRTTRFLYRERW